jgi:hypothetical protein
MQQRQRGAELRIEGGGRVTVLAASFSFGGGLPLRVAHGYNSLCYLSSQQMEASVAVHAQLAKRPGDGL